ncbi:MAG: ribonuclease HII [Lachnospiraceae bacterium]|jgi:ribonuclease HII|nr:ribonuclease HII [Lachnospiraceae bacterium]
MVDGFKEYQEKERKAYLKYARELLRLDEMSVFEREYSNLQYICGIDEAGRGPLAGPVVAGAIVLPKDEPILYLNDSKKLSPKMRERLMHEIVEKCIACGAGIIDAPRIDEINILQATYEAMRLAIKGLLIKPDILLVDAVTIPDVEYKQVPIIKGDAKSISIAAASILAKVHRDRMMVHYDDEYPEYGFAKHKGYGTPEHIAALKKYGPCPIHRKTFIRKILEGK